MAVEDLENVSRMSLGNGRRVQAEGRKSVSAHQRESSVSGFGDERAGNEGIPSLFSPFFYF